MSRARGHRRPYERALLAAVPVLVLVASACGSWPSLPNPFASASAPTPTRGIPGPATGQEAAESPPTPAPFEPFWVQNHRTTEMWNGPAGQPSIVSFGATSGQFCSFLVVLPPEGDRLYVFNPYAQDYLWIDAADVGPADPPEPRPGPKPDGNCSREAYSD